METSRWDRLVIEDLPDSWGVCMYVHSSTKVSAPFPREKDGEGSVGGKANEQPTSDNPYVSDRYRMSILICLQVTQICL